MTSLASVEQIFTTQRTWSPDNLHLAHCSVYSTLVDNDTTISDLERYQIIKPRDWCETNVVLVNIPNNEYWEIMAYTNVDIFIIMPS